MTDFKFDLRQVVRYPSAELPGTVIARTERAAGEPHYLVRPCESESLTEGVTQPESELVAF